MKSFTFQTLPPEFQQALDNIREGNKLESRGKKLKEIGKAFLTDFLKRERSLELEALPIGEIVSVNNGFCVIQIGKQNRFDADGFAISNPTEYLKWKKDFPTVQFKV